MNSGCFIIKYDITSAINIAIKVIKILITFLFPNNENNIEVKIIYIGIAIIALMKVEKQILFTGIFLLVPVSFSQKNRVYKLIILVGSFLFRNRTFYYHLETDDVRRDQYKKFTRTIQRTKAKK